MVRPYVAKMTISHFAAYFLLVSSKVADEPKVGSMLLVTVWTSLQHLVEVFRNLGIDIGLKRKAGVKFTWTFRSGLVPSEQLKSHERLCLHRVLLLQDGSEI